jgi:hypothetical protein
MQASVWSQSSRGCVVFQLALRELTLYDSDDAKKRKQLSCFSVDTVAVRLVVSSSARTVDRIGCVSFAGISGPS